MSRESLYVRRKLTEYAKRLADGKSVKGFRRFKSTYRTMDAYYSRELRVVIKRHVNILDPRTPLGLRVPTMKLFEYWVAQPLVRKTNLRKAVDLVESRMSAYGRRFYTDVHVGNVGWYAREALLFDW